MIKYLLSLWLLLGLSGCAPKLDYLSTGCQESVYELSQILKFDRRTKTYHVEKPPAYKAYSNDFFWQKLFLDLDCHKICGKEKLYIKDAEKIFGVKLKYVSPGIRFKHDGSGMLQYTPEVLKNSKLRNYTPDIVFFFGKDKKTIEDICFYFELH